jgi:hypothetical protein
MEFLNQHFVTEAYLRAWCDPETPNGAFVWRVSKEKRKISMTSPKTLFSEPDFYTVYDSNGNRILNLEQELKKIEERFIILRDKKLQSHQPLTTEDRRTLALFISTMFARTKRQKEEQLNIWQEYSDFIETFPAWFASQIKQTEEYRQVQELHQNQPMPYHLFHFINMTVPYLCLMNYRIYDTKINPGLITSDNPCFWFDPAIYDPHSPITFFGIGSPTLNILFPISPKQFISLERDGPDGYFDLHTNPKKESEMVDLINGLIAKNCEEFIVVNQSIFKGQWFES